MLYLYNSLTRRKEAFTPLIPGKIGLYVCGITVYDHCHLGHARSMVCFDMMVRFLRSQGFEVTMVRNITDIDDKIIRRAQERGVSIYELTEQYIQSMQQDAQALNILPPNSEPRATDHLTEIVQLIERLLAQGHAYVSDNGDVCFEVERFTEYGKLAHKDLAGLIAGARIDVVKEKRSPLDFVLWKKAKDDEPSWPSPWGAGRPGWHIECSAMAMSHLGEQFDIHGGGLDLQFPHHENEIAQSEAASGKPFANYWLHVGMLQLNNEKMAKSTGNFLTIAEALKQYHPEVMRYFLLSSHYRSPLNYSHDNLDQARRAVRRLYQASRGWEELTDDVSCDDRANPWIERFEHAMRDDFNTPSALAVLFELTHEINKTRHPHLILTLKKLASLLGLLHHDAGSVLQDEEVAVDKTVIEQLIEQRLVAKKAKQWAQADAIRASLWEQGIELEDGPQGITTWRKRLIAAKH